MDPVLLREAMSYRAVGIAVATTRDPSGMDVALTASSFAAVSLDPPLTVIGVRRAGRFQGALLARRRWAVTLLAGDQELIAATFARPRTEHRPEDLERWPTRRMPGGSLVFTAGLAAVECVLAGTVDAGTATLVIGQVTSAVRGTGEDPLLYFRRAYRVMRGAPIAEAASARSLG